MAGYKKGGLNDFVIRIATVNGTGSASANGLLMKAIFRVGIPVSAKNFFPSNIQGLPTWFEIRVNKDNHLALAGRVDLMIDGDNKPWIIEVNTVPGMTDHSLIPMAGRCAGLEMPDLVLSILAATLKGEG